MSGSSIEDGYFVFTLMPSLFCHLRCPHCYLSLKERQDRTVLGPELIEAACRKIDDYWNARQLMRREVICYWYGGEPTSLGIPLFQDMADRINAVFSVDRGYSVKHTILTSLVSVKSDWHRVFDSYGNGQFQTSFDGTMRGAAYVQKWERKVKEAVVAGLKVSTISVVNRDILQMGARQTLDYLSDLGVQETSWLPFMWNKQNDGEMYDMYAPTMARWSAFMIELTQSWAERKLAGQPVPEIGQMRFIMGQGASDAPYSNIAGQTLFLMPNGDFVLPDYKDGWMEFMQPFGNILTQDFNSILRSPARRAYLRRQVMRNGNEECLSCDHASRCVMEFWKDNRPEDDCFGGKRYVEWLLANKADLQPLIGAERSVRLY